MRIEDEHPDVLQNIEFAVATFYRKHPEMTDYTAMRVYEALIKLYSAEAFGRDPKPSPLSALETELFESAHAMCEWRLGRSSIDAEGDTSVPSTQIDLDTLMLCLKRLRKSAERWNKHGGRQGYLKFMSQYVR